MNSSYPSFLSENANRAFPFIENLTSSTIVKNNYFLDFRGWTKFKVNDNPSFYLVVKKGKEDIDLPNNIPSQFYDFFIKDNFLHLFFSIHKLPTNAEKYNSLVCLYVPLENSSWPYLAKTNLFNSVNTKMYEFKTLVNESILNIVEDNNYSFINEEHGLSIEPSQVFYSGGAVVDELEILNDMDGQKRIVTGDIKIVPGFNCSMLQSDNSISINSVNGLGIGKKYNNEITDICNGIFSINGVNPNNSGIFKIKGSNGVLIFDSPNDSQIIISLDPTINVAKCQT